MCFVPPRLEISRGSFPPSLSINDYVSLVLIRSEGGRQRMPEKICRRRGGCWTGKVFDLFDLKRNGVIEFGEFVRSLSIFHPHTAQDEKIAFAFRLYDLRSTGFIEPEELKELVLAILNESNLYLSDDIVDMIVDQTYKLVDTNSDGKIDSIEWKEFVKKNPSVLKNMTLPYLKDLTTAFPSFVMNSEIDEVVI